MTTMHNRLGDELVQACWQLLSKGQPQQALERAERALRTYRPPMDSLLAGRLYLVVGVSLAAIGKTEAARHYFRDASWALENATDPWSAPPRRVRSGRSRPGKPSRGCS